jgi:flagellar motor switch protein FliM
MEKILEQKMIDTLFATQADGKNAEGGKPEAVVPYSFGQAEQISNEQMRAINMVNDQLARSLTHTLAAWLRSQVFAMVAANEQMTYAEYLTCLPDPCYVCVLRLEPMGGYGLLEINLGLAMMMVDVLLGGHGDVGKVRELTDIENTILMSVMEIVVRELNAAWDTAGLRFDLQPSETREGIMRLMPSDERTLCVSIDIEMDGTHGLLNLCLPSVILNAMHRRLRSVRETPRRRLEASTLRVCELVSDSSFRASLRLPTMRLSSRKLQSLVPGALLELPLPRYTMAEMLVEGVRLCSAVPVGRGEHRAALLREIPCDPDRALPDGEQTSSTTGAQS